MGTKGPWGQPAGVYVKRSMHFFQFKNWVEGSRLSSLPAWLSSTSQPIFFLFVSTMDIFTEFTNGKNQLQIKTVGMHTAGEVCKPIQFIVAVWLWTLHHAIKANSNYYPRLSSTPRFNTFRATKLRKDSLWRSPEATHVWASRTLWYVWRHSCSRNRACQGWTSWYWCSVLS